MVGSTWIACRLSITKAFNRILSASESCAPPVHSIADTVSASVDSVSVFADCLLLVPTLILSNYPAIPLSSTGPGAPTGSGEAPSEYQKKLDAARLQMEDQMRQNQQAMEELNKSWETKLKEAQSLKKEEEACSCHCIS